MDTLTLFNQQVLQCQDDAYTLAWYLLGDETEAEAVMQEAVERAFDCFSARQANCRLLILKRVVEQCRERRPAHCGSAEANIFTNLDLLADQERVALVLVDVLGLGYPEAAYIINLPLIKIGSLLAHARRKMITQKVGQVRSATQNDTGQVPN